MIDVGGTPVVLILFLILPLTVGAVRPFVRAICAPLRREIVQQSRLGCHTTPHHPFQISVLIPFYILLRKGITSPCNQRRRIDDQSTQIFRGGAEAGEDILCGPFVGGGVPGEGGVVFLAGGGGRGSAVEGGVGVEGAVDVVGAFEGVGDAGFESFFA